MSGVHRKVSPSQRGVRCERREGRELTVGVGPTFRLGGPVTSVDSLDPWSFRPVEPGREEDDNRGEVNLRGAVPVTTGPQR